jgi:hypothetical protein
MRIYATFINYAEDPEVATMIHAWDEYAFYDNPTGYEDSKQAALAKDRDNLLNSVTVTIALGQAGEDAIHDALNPSIELLGSIENIEEA